MARKQVFEVHCSRCTRTEHREGSADKPEKILSAKLFGDGTVEGDLEVTFDDLCSPCLKSVRALLAQVGKKIEGLSPARTAKSDEDKAKKEATAPVEAKAEAKKEGQAPHGTHPASHAVASKNGTPLGRAL